MRKSKDLIRNYLISPHMAVAGVDQFYKACPIDFDDPNSELVPEYYLDQVVPTSDEIKDGVEETIRNAAAFLVREGVAARGNFPGSERENLRHQSAISWRKIQLTNLFTLDRGDFNSYQEFPPGDELVVSRTSDNNGVAGHYEPPEEARRFPIGTISISTVSGDAFVQTREFYASDKVVLCRPKRPLRPTTLFFTTVAINHQRWRYSYGRSCFKRTIELTTVDMPCKENGEIDEDLIEHVIRQAAYWPIVVAQFPTVKQL